MKLLVPWLRESCCRGHPTPKLVVFIIKILWVISGQNLEIFKPGETTDQNSWSSGYEKMVSGVT